MFATRAYDAAMAVDISVVIPCHNGERFVEHTLVSAMQQDVAPDELEVIVVDDGSTDTSAQIVSDVAGHDPRVRLIRTANAGVAVARNTGLRACSPSARFVHFLDADDVLLPGAVRQLRERLLSDERLVAAVGACSRIDPDGHLLWPAVLPFEAYVVGDRRISRVTSPARLDYWHVLPITPISTPGQCLIRRSALPDEPYDTSLEPCEDWALWLHITRHGDIGVVEREVLRYRDHPQSVSKRAGLMRQQREAVYARQRAVIGDQRVRLRRAWRFGMYRFDAMRCLRWAREQLRDGEPLGAARFALRSAGFGARFVVAVITRHPPV